MRLTTWIAVFFLMACGDSPTATIETENPFVGLPEHSRTRPANLPTLGTTDIEIFYTFTENEWTWNSRIVGGRGIHKLWGKYEWWDWWPPEPNTYKLRLHQRGSWSWNFEEGVPDSSMSSDIVDLKVIISPILMRIETSTYHYR